MGPKHTEPTAFGDEHWTEGAPQTGFEQQETGCHWTHHPTAVGTTWTLLGSRNSFVPAPLGTTDSFTCRDRELP